MQDIKACKRVAPLAEIETKLHPYPAIVFKGCDSPALIINGDRDHIHALFMLARTWTVADVVEEVKKRSSKWLKTKDAKLQPFQWQVDDGAFSVSQSQVEQVRRYVSNQKAHRHKQSFQDEYCALLQNMGSNLTKNTFGLENQLRGIGACVMFAPRSA